MPGASAAPRALLAASTQFQGHECEKLSPRSRRLMGARRHCEPGPISSDQTRNVGRRVSDFIVLGAKFCNFERLTAAPRNTRVPWRIDHSGRGRILPDGRPSPDATPEPPGGACLGPNRMFSILCGAIRRRTGRTCFVVAPVRGRGSLLPVRVSRGLLAGDALPVCVRRLAAPGGGSTPPLHLRRVTRRRAISKTPVLRPKTCGFALPGRGSSSKRGPKRLPFPSIFGSFWQQNESYQRVVGRPAVEIFFSALPTGAAAGRAPPDRLQAAAGGTASTETDIRPSP